MSVNINKWDVLVVNRAWLVLGTTTIRNAIKSLFSSPDGYTMAAKAFQIDYEQTGENQYNFENLTYVKDVSLEEWLALEIRSYDSFISTAKQKIRIPTVIMAQNCEKTNLRPIKLSVKNILERDGFVCQYTGQKLPRHKLNIDHVVPRDRGGGDTWTNLVTSSIDINSKKGNKLNSEAGLTLIREPKAPLPKPASSLIREIRYKDWEVFLHK